MEEDISGESFSVTQETPQSEYGKYLDSICPYYMLYGMSWDEFWYESLDRLEFYWRMNQLSIEKRNQELWMQGIYIQEAVAAVLDVKKQAKYPQKPHRITELSDIEKEAEQKRQVSEMRERLNAFKQMWDSKAQKGRS